MEIRNGDITIRGSVTGEGPTVVLLHGFPQTSHCWHQVVGPLAAAGYRVVTPDLRGFGASDKPADVGAYRMDVCVSDVVAVIEEHGGSAVVIGHDWGASLAWSTAALRPDKVRAVAALSVPFTRRSSAPPIERLVEKAGGAFFYMDYFQEPGVAEAELSSSTRDIMLALLHTASGAAAYKAPGKRCEARFGDGLTLPDALPSWLAQEDLDIYVRAFEEGGWTGGLNWYRAMDPSWRALPTIGTEPLRMPSAFLAGERDMVLAFTPIKHHAELLADLREQTILPGIGHWVAEEAPAETTAFLLRFLSSLES